MKKIILVVLFFVATIAILYMVANMANSEYSTEQTKEAMSRNIPIIDIRRLEEWKKYGIIDGSHTITFFNKKGKFNLDLWMSKFKKIVKDKNQEFILVCAHANRTKVVLKFLQEQLNYTNAHDLEGGINYGWLDKGLKTTVYR